MDKSQRFIAQKGKDPVSRFGLPAGCSFCRSLVRLSCLSFKAK